MKIEIIKRHCRKTTKLERTRYRNHNKLTDFFLGFTHTFGFPLLLCDSFTYVTDKVSNVGRRSYRR